MSNATPVLDRQPVADAETCSLEDFQRFWKEMRGQCEQYVADVFNWLTDAVENDTPEATNLIWFLLDGESGGLSSGITTLFHGYERREAGK